jgi:PAS domain S-box-containing protein
MEVRPLRVSFENLSKCPFPQAGIPEFDRRGPREIVAAPHPGPFASLEDKVEAGSLDPAEPADAETCYRLLVHGLEDPAVVLLSPAGVVTSWNRGAERLLGHVERETVGRPLADLISPAEPVDALRRELEEAAARGRAERQGWRQRKDGSHFLARCLTIALRDTAGRLLGFAYLVRDITAEKRLEESFRAAVAHSIDAIITIDEQGIIQSCSGAFQHIFGYPADELIGHNVKMLMPEPWRSQHDDAIADYLRSEAAKIIGRLREVSGQRKDGGVVPLELAVNEFFLHGRQFFTAILRDIRERKQAESALRESEERFRTIFEHAPIGVALLGPDGRFLRVNAALARSLGYSAEVLAEKSFLELTHPEDVERDWKLAKQILDGQIPSCAIDTRYIRKDGQVLWMQGRASVLRDGQGKVALLAMLEDVTERRHIDEQLRQARKMEAIGRLAGGIAHDFNNLLTIINGFSEMLLRLTPPDDAKARLLRDIHRAGERAAALTGQLLAFSRKPLHEPRVLNLNEVLANIERMLRRLIGEDIFLHIDLDPQLRRVKVDAGQIEQVVMNLAVNARDAMPQGGTLTLRTANLDLHEEECSNFPGARPGPYVLLSVSDSGCGMTPEVKARIFEPFFTTKEFGKGTGLGLATVYGIVKQCDGSIAVDSQPGAGATFRIIFPAAAPEIVLPSDSKQGIRTVPQGRETILLVEDEEGVRKLVRLTLEGNGYRVLEANDGQQALWLADTHDGNIHLVITDVVMPALSGQELIDRLRRRFPAMKVLFMTGYLDDTLLQHHVRVANCSFLPKPFSMVSLAQKVRAVLDADSAAAS